MSSIRNHPLLKLALFVFIVCCVVMFINLQLKFNSLKAERDLLTEEIAAAEERISELRDTLNTPFDDDYIISVAREKLNLRLPEELVFYNNLLK